MKFKSNLVATIISGIVTIMLSIVVSTHPDVLKLKPLMANSSIVTTPEKTHNNKYPDQYTEATIVKTKIKNQTDRSQTTETESTKQVSQTKKTQVTDKNKKDLTVNKETYETVARVTTNSNNIDTQTHTNPGIESDNQRPNNTGPSSSNDNNNNSSYESTTITNDSQESSSSSSSSGNNSESTEDSTTNSSSDPTTDSTTTSTEITETTTEPSIENIN